MKFEFTSTLFRYPGPGGWVFAPVPDQFAAPVKLAWGRTPVRVTFQGRTWDTSVWTETDGRILLPMAKKYRGPADHGDRVTLVLEYLA